MDIFIQEHIFNESKPFLVLEVEPYRFVSTTGLGKYIEGLNNITVGQFKKGEELITQAAQQGDPYSIYYMYKIFSSQNSFGISLNKEAAWYYLICANISFFTSLVYEESPMEILQAYQETFDNDKFEVSLEIIESGIENDCTPFLYHKKLVKHIFLYIMQYEEKTQKEEIIKYCQTNLDFPKEVLFLYLFLIHNEDLKTTFNIIKDMNIREYLTSVKDCILMFNQSGILGSSGTSVGLYNSILFAFGYIIFLGKSSNKENENIEEIVTELFKFCLLANYRDPDNYTETNQECYKYLEKLDPLVNGIISYMYFKGYHLTKNIEKAKEYMKVYSDIEEDRESENSDLTSLSDYLIFIGRYKIYKEEFPEKALKTLEFLSKWYNEEELKQKEDILKPIDYYIAGYIQEKFYGDAQKANSFYMKGVETNVPAEDYGRVLEFLAFKRKCQTKLEKRTIVKNLQNDEK